MKKVFVLILVVALVIVANAWGKADAELKALREYNSIEGNTPYKTLYPAEGPDGRASKKIIDSEGHHEFVPVEAVVNLETGEWKMP